MAFNSINRQFKTVADFTAYLATLAPPAWARGSTYHNTFSPTEAEWHGKATMDGMQAYYVGKGWSSGPHCYLALHSPNPNDNGIWIMTPPTAQGTHAGPCNSDHWGIEVVGDFNTTPPASDQQQLLVDTVAALHRWARLGPNLNAHRDCMADRTCPGDAFYTLKPSLQARLAAALDRLKARSLPGPPPANVAIYCSAGAATFYAMRGGLPYCGYPLRDMFHDSSLNADVLVCERVVIKESTQFGLEQALLYEAIREGWLL